MVISRITNILLIVSTLLAAGGCAGSDPNAGAAFREQGARDFESAYTSYVNLADVKNSLERPVIFNACAAENVQDMEYYFRQYIERGYLLVGEVLLDTDKYNLEITADHCGQIGAEQALYYSPPAAAEPPLAARFSLGQATYQGLLGNYPGSAAPKASRADAGRRGGENNPYKTWVTYWVKVKPPTLGAYYGEIPDTLKSAAKNVRGAYVYLVIKGSPAQRRNIRPGDIITRLADYKINAPEDLTAALAAKSGRRVDLRVTRKKEFLRVSLTLNPPVN